ncbi:MAG: N-6 DNA methylase, partial [Gemmatimonadota bacterium]
MLAQALRSKVDHLWDKFWSGGIANPLTAIEQISYLLFMRRLDALDEKRRGDAEFLKQEFRSLFGGAYTTRAGKKRPCQELRWSKFRHLPAEEMLEHVRDNVFPFIKTLEDGGQVFTRYMQDAVFIIPKASLLVEAVGIMDDLYAELERERQDAGQSAQDVQGDLYEYLLAEIQSAGKNGQFRTPRHLIQLIVTLVDPRLGEEVCDPACGTGGFLLGAYQHILTQHTNAEHRFIGEDGIERGL